MRAILNGKGQVISLALFLWAAPLPAALHYLDRGTAYHLGDERLATSRDRGQVALHPVVGTVWERDFIASADDQVEVVLEALRGVDAAGGRIVEVMVDGEVVGELNAGESGPWRSVLKAPVRAGKKHTLRIVTRGLPDPDDFIFEGVQVRSFSGASVRPEGPVRIFTPRPAAAKLKALVRPTAAPTVPPEDRGPVFSREAPCGIYGPWNKWRPDTRKGSLVLSVGQDRQVLSDPLARQPMGTTFDFYFRVKGLAASETGKHRLDIRVGDGPRDGWFFEIEDPGRRRPSDGPIQASHLWGRDRDPLVLKPGFNRVRVHYCVEDLVWIMVNDKVFPKAVRGMKKDRDVVVAVRGIELELARTEAGP